MIRSKSLERLISALHRLPGIGPKSAQRLAFHILKSSRSEANELAQAILGAKEKMKSCSVCGNITDSDPCFICDDSTRDGNTICVVEQPQDIFVFEKMGEYKGTYHVLMGALSPLDGVGPDDLKIKDLVTRIEKGKIREVIIATNPNAEGEATATYLSKIIKPLGIKVTRLAQGMPMGGDLEYADEVTLAKALEGRREL
ncbi:recombination protein RecR [bacterium]|nr:recombination protein RecR [bacterium]NIN92112.1 recombination protein RecR [bacterium]NIO18318.1 recombination protein RecR [bacterium]NIO73283.1 recombination protein RecR [bacterium]